MDLLRPAHLYPDYPSVLPSTTKGEEAYALISPYPISTSFCCGCCSSTPPSPGSSSRDRQFCLLSCLFPCYSYSLLQSNLSLDYLESEKDFLERVREPTAALPIVKVIDQKEEGEKQEQEREAEIKRNECSFGSFCAASFFHLPIVGSIITRYLITGTGSQNDKFDFCCAPYYSFAYGFTKHCRCKDSVNYKDTRGATLCFCFPCFLTSTTVLLPLFCYFIPIQQKLRELDLRRKWRGVEQTSCCASCFPSPSEPLSSRLPFYFSRKYVFLIQLKSKASSPMRNAFDQTLVRETVGRFLAHASVECFRFLASPMEVWKDNQPDHYHYELERFLKHTRVIENSPKKSSSASVELDELNKNNKAEEQLPPDLDMKFAS